MEEVVAAGEVLHPQSQLHTIREVSKKTHYWCPKLQAVVSACGDCESHETVEAVVCGDEDQDEEVERVKSNFRLCLHYFKWDSYTTEIAQKLTGVSNPTPGQFWNSSLVKSIDKKSVKRYARKWKTDENKAVKTDSPWRNEKPIEINLPKHTPPKVRYYLSIEITKPNISAEIAERFISLIGEGVIRCENYFLKQYVIRESFQGNLEKVFIKGEYKVLKRIAVPR